MWHAIETIETIDTGGWCAEVQVPAESAWFSGHFPGDPILPGIAQLGMACEVLRRGAGEGFRLAGFSRIKFKKIIRPGDCLKISVMPKKDFPDAYTFRIVVGADIACSGAMALARQDVAGCPGNANAS
jgi:3-hydroxyacyl-[acyl-carrier-protein] dehydratase